MTATKDLLHRWLKRARESAFAHYAAEERCSHLHYLLGVPAAILAAIVGTAVFASLDTAVDTRIKIAVGFTSIVAAVLSGIQTFLRYSERADRHRVAASKYGAIRRHLEQLLIYPDQVTYSVVDEIRKALDALSADAPNISAKLWARSKQNADNDYFLSNPRDLPDTQPMAEALISSDLVADNSIAESVPVRGREPAGGR